MAELRQLQQGIAICGMGIFTRNGSLIMKQAQSRGDPRVEGKHLVAKRRTVAATKRAAER